MPRVRLAGRYELVQRLGQGGMAEVWLAIAHGDAGFTRRVAVKRLFANATGDAAFERMFLDEARITSRLHHSGIVGILDYGLDEGRPFQVLELVDGFDAWQLSEAGRAKGHPLPVHLALHIVGLVAQALHFAHLANIVHRDVSPQNVLLSLEGDVKLSDFGIAFAEDRLEKTVGGVARGKPAYMAPEQAMRGAIDGRTDVFALGCVLHALLTGRSPLHGENALIDLLAGIEVTVDQSLPLEVQALITRATRRNKHERHETADAFAQACLSGRADTGVKSELAAWVKAVAPERVELKAIAPTAPPRKRSRLVWLVPVAALAVGAVASWPETAAVREDDDVSAPKVETRFVQPVVVEPTPTVAPPPPVKPRPSAPVVPVGNGVLAIGGETFVRGTVEIDGVARGTAPAQFEVSVGAHHVEVTSRSGQRFSRDVRIAEDHTSRAPLYWLE